MVHITFYSFFSLLASSTSWICQSPSIVTLLAPSLTEFFSNHSQPQSTAEVARNMYQTSDVPHNVEFLSLNRTWTHLSFIFHWLHIMLGLNKFLHLQPFLQTLLSTCFFVKAIEIITLWVGKVFEKYLSTNIALKNPLKGYELSYTMMH